MGRPIMTSNCSTITKADNMLHAVRQRVTIGQDETVHIRVPELKPGTVADVIILEAYEQIPKKALQDLLEKEKDAIIVQVTWTLLSGMSVAHGNNREHIRPKNLS